VEQGALLLGLLRDGLVPGVVFWGHTVFSLRKNEIRAELVPLYGSLPAAETGSPAVILIGGPTRPAGEAPPLPQRVLQAATQRLDQWCSASAMVRFSRRELSEKADLLWRTPLGGLVPPRLRPGTGVQRDPSASVLEGNARFAGQVTAVLRARGVRVIHFLAPVNRATEPRPFSARSEAVAYPALERAVRARGGEYVSWLDLLPPSCFGRFVDGSADALHIRPAGHTALVRRILALLDEAPRRAAGAAPAR
jgi:hypothetical protein